MKVCLNLSCLLLLSTLLFAGNIPGEVQKAFELKFPGATTVKWDKENAHEYEASFEWKAEKYSANFSVNGQWLETESPLTFNQLPAKVQGAFNSAHKGATIKDTSKIETSKGTVKYEVEMKQGVKTIELFYNADGTSTKE